MRNPNSLASYLRNTVYTRPALVPALPWKQGNNPGSVTNLAYSGGTLTWNGYDNVRYSVYAFPASMNPATFTKQVEYLLDMSYTTSYKIPVEYQSNEWQYAVCVVDRVGNEYEPVFLGSSLKALGNPALIGPANEATIDMPFTFSWHKVKDAANYVVEISNDADFGNVVERYTTTDTIASALQFSQLRHEANQYWRVQACEANHYCGVSEIRTIVPKLLTVTYPADGEEEVAPDFTAKWYNVNSTNVATVEISDDEAFQNILYTGKSANGELAIPDGKLESGITCYMRVRLTVDGQEMVSLPVHFTIVHLAAHLLRPTEGGEIYMGEYVEVKPQSWATSYQIEISTSATTWGRTRFVETLKDGATRTSLTADNIKVNSKKMENGKTYYARVKTAYEGLDGAAHTTEWGPVVKFVYRTEKPVSGDINGDGEVNASDATALINHLLGTESYPTNLCDVNGDSEVNSSDVTALINKILGN